MFVQIWEISKIFPRCKILLAISTLRKHILKQTRVFLWIIIFSAYPFTFVVSDDVRNIRFDLRHVNACKNNPTTEEAREKLDISTEGKERRVREKASPDLINKMYGDYKECLSERLDEASSRFKASFSTTIRAMSHPRFLSTLTSLSMSDCASTCKIKGELRSSSNRRFVRFTRNQGRRSFAFWNTILNRLYTHVENFFKNLL